MIEGCENVILDDFKDQPEATNKLIKQVSSKVQSEFFETKNNDNNDGIQGQEKGGL